MNRKYYWPLWDCISRESLAALAIYQWDAHGLKLELLGSMILGKVEVEDLQEIDKIMRQKPKTKARA